MPLREPRQPENTQARTDSGSDSESDEIGRDEIDEESRTYVPQPVFIRNLQSQFFGQKGDFTSESFMLGDIVTRGLIGSDLAERLLSMCVNLSPPEVQANL